MSFITIFNHSESSGTSDEVSVMEMEQQPQAVINYTKYIIYKHSSSTTQKNSSPSREIKKEVGAYVYNNVLSK